MTSLKTSQFGSDNGQIVIYFHGVPSAPEECRVLDAEGKSHHLTFLCFDRFAMDLAMTGEAYFQVLANEILKKADGKQVDIIGFSIGAFVALQTCRYLEGHVRNLHLISAAAPLEAGNFLDEMAGKQVFQLAKKAPALFILLSYWQKMLAVFFPKALFFLLFANAVGEDKALAANREFQSTMITILKSCFQRRVLGYAREIKAYVQPWHDSLADITAKTYLWHGTEDNWSPNQMALYLKSAMPHCENIEFMEGLSHYSCLYKAAPKICESLNQVIQQ